MKIGKYETGIINALKDRLFPTDAHPKRMFWWSTEGWITDPQQIENALRLDDTWKLSQRLNQTISQPGPVKNAKTQPLK